MNNKIIITTQAEWDNLSKDFCGTIVIDAPFGIIKLEETKGHSIIVFSSAEIGADVFVQARIHAYVIARDKSSVLAYGNACVDVYDKSHTDAYDATMIRAYDESTVNAHNDVIVIVHDKACAKAEDNAIIVFYKNTDEEDGW